MSSFEDFKKSQVGQIVGEILADHDNQVKLVCLAEHGLPPAQAVGAEIAARVGILDDTLKQHIGRWVRSILSEKGWKPIVKGARVAPGNLFSRASLYGRKEEPKT